MDAKLLIAIAISSTWLVCLVVCILKAKYGMAVVSLLAAVAQQIGLPPIGGYYILNLIYPLWLLPIFAAMRLANPRSYYAYWFYRHNLPKYFRAVQRFGLEQEYADLVAQRTQDAARDASRELDHEDKAQPAFDVHKDNSVCLAGLGAFQASSDAYYVALNGIETYTTRANHRHSISDARRALDKASGEDYADAAAAYNETIAACSDPADHTSYSDAELRAHTMAIDALSAGFYALKSAFNALDDTIDLYPTATTLYKACCDTQVFATRAYSYAANCAMISALEMQLQVAKDRVDLHLLELRANNPSQADPVGVRAKAAARKAKLDEDTAKANRLEEEAKIAERKAEGLLGEAKSAQVMAENVLDYSPRNT